MGFLKSSEDGSQLIVSSDAAFSMIPGLFDSTKPAYNVVVFFLIRAMSYQVGIGTLMRAAAIQKTHQRHTPSHTHIEFLVQLLC